MSDQGSLRNVLERLTPRIREYRNRERSLVEQETKTKLINPVLEALDWDVQGDDVEQEFKARPRDNPVDYALKLSRVPVLFVEAKALGQDLSERKRIAQVLGYATVAGVGWCVLTDGDEYHLYSANAPVHADEKLFCKTRISEGKVDEAANVLTLFSRSNMQENRIASLWKALFVDRQVRMALLNMFDPADKSLVRLIHKKVPALKPQEIATAMMRLGIRIDPPILPPPPSPPLPPLPKPSTGRKPKAQDGLADLIAAGVLKAPVRLFSKYKDRTFEATLLSSGEVEFQGQRYSSPSDAGGAAKATIAGRKMATNGWDFWQIEGDGGKPRTLGQVRGAYLKR